MGEMAKERFVVEFFIFLSPFYTVIRWGGGGGKRE